MYVADGISIMRYFFEIAYKGTGYHGWQIQNSTLTVQGTVEKALSTVLQRKVGIVGSGRTDTGVHCTQQFFHLDLPDEMDGALLGYKLNTLLPKDMVIHSVRKVITDAHARFDAVLRSYEYRISERRDPFAVEFSYCYNKKLDIKTMNAAAALLIGKEDFQAFSKVKTQVNNFICDIKEAYWEKSPDGMIFHISANRFLRGMVRAIVGTLMDVGLAKCDVEGFKEIIASKDRRRAGRAVPPEGLFLTRVNYPEEIFINQ